MQQLPLFGYRETIAQSEQEAIQRLPITDVNELLSILRTHQNTVLHEMQKEIQNGNM